jgi:hypothetical protein
VTSTLLLAAGLSALGQPTVLRDTRLLLRGIQGADSWRPMAQAHAHLREVDRVSGEPVPLYDWLFFDRRVKFIYPPTALLGIELLDRSLPRGRWSVALVALSLLMVTLNAALVAAVLDRELSRVAPPVSRLDRGIRVTAAALLTLCFYPVVKAYSLGQAQVVVNALLAALVLAWSLGSRALSGVLVAAMCAIKPQYALIAVWGVARREWRFVGAAAAAGLGVLALSVWTFGLAHHLNYLDVLATISRVGEAYYPNQSVNGLLQRAMDHGDSLRWDPHDYPPYHPLVHAGTLLSSLALLGLTVLWRPWRPVRGGSLDLCAIALAATLASPIAWEHHHGVLLPIYACLLPALLQRPVLHRATFPVLAISFVLSSHFLPAANRLAGTPLAAVQSYLLFAALTVLALLTALLHAPTGGLPTDPIVRSEPLLSPRPGAGEL